MYVEKINICKLHEKASETKSPVAELNWECLVHCNRWQSFRQRPNWLATAGKSGGAVRSGQPRREILSYVTPLCFGIYCHARAKTRRETIEMHIWTRSGNVSRQFHSVIFTTFGVMFSVIIQHYFLLHNRLFFLGFSVAFCFEFEFTEIGMDLQACWK